MHKPMIAVTGATGAQGGAVVNALLKAKFRVRALTRNVDSDKAKALLEKGCTVAFADYDKPENLAESFKGC